MKINELRKKSDEELIQLRKDLKYELIKASCKFTSGKADRKELDIGKRKGITKSGEKTSLCKELRKAIAQINTLLNERENEKTN